MRRGDEHAAPARLRLDQPFEARYLGALALLVSGKRRDREHIDIVTGERAEGAEGGAAHPPIVLGQAKEAANVVQRPGAHTVGRPKGHAAGDHRQAQRHLRRRVRHGPAQELEQLPLHAFPLLLAPTIAERTQRMVPKSRLGRQGECEAECDVYFVLVMYIGEGGAPMQRMRRTQIYIDEELDEALAQHASARGMSKAGILRLAARRYLAEERPDPEDDPILGIIGLGRGEPGNASIEHDRYLTDEMESWRSR